MPHRSMSRFLLEHANPSIRYRVKTEILHQEVPESEKQTLQAQVLSEPIIRSIIACQKENGWLGNGFHGPNKNAGPFENQEVGTKYLGEKLVCKDTPVLKRAMEAYATTPLTDPCYRTHGKLIDEFKHAANGQNIIRCACISRTVKSGGKEKRVFLPNEKWPCYYHLDILAHTNSWKTEENIRALAQAVERLMRTDRPDKQLGADSWVGHVLGTVGCFREGFALGCDEREGKHYTYLDRVEWLCRCGVAPYLPALQQEVDRLAAAVTSDGICEADIDENQLKGFSTYGGQQLETDWKTPIRRQCDVTFRALLILHYADAL